MKPDLEIIYPKLFTLNEQIIFKIIYPKKSIEFRGIIDENYTHDIYINFYMFNYNINNDIIFAKLRINKKKFFKDIPGILNIGIWPFTTSIDTLRLMLKMLENYKEM